MKKYEAPKAEQVLFETSDIIVTSDLFDFLITWGKMVEDVDSDSANVDFYD